jgi:fibronectin type 3 domain-containing protein
VQRIARVQVDGRTIELAGEISQPIRVDAQDVFPPAVPTGLAAVATAGEAGAVPSIDLNWEPNTEPDLAGYFVYRREEETPWQRVSGDKPVAGPAFHDIGVLPGHTYRYSVSAVDRGGHESGRSAETQETVPNP